MAYKTRQVTLDGIDIKVTYKPIRNLRLAVKPPDGSVRASVPTGTSDAALWAFLRPRVSWIREAHHRMVRPVREPKHVESGESFPLWGADYTLVLVPWAGERIDEAVNVAGEHLYLSVPRHSGEASRKRVLERWYRAQVAAAIEALRVKWEPTFDVRPTEYSIRFMKTRWGSCNQTTGRVNLNLELVKHPPDIIENTFVHELCHLITHGHGPQFQLEMSLRLPHWRAERKLTKGIVIGNSFWE
ncbi:MAG: M48 family metallopeptidase [Propionibacteriaceae bacterium]|jgi:predicted metal-dependent hydrolase|nr:M48 family metallopeptidase [Propionibacteriaceae bacterium]